MIDFTPSQFRLPKHIPEPELTNRLLEGDESALREIINRYHKKVYLFVLSFLKDKDKSDEVVQDTFLSFWLFRKRLNPDKPLAPLLFTIARRKLIDCWRKEAMGKRYFERISEITAGTHNETQEQVYVKDIERTVDELLDRFTEQQKQVFTLSRYENLSYDEIAERLQISRNTVKYHLVNALKMLRAHFSKHDIL